MNKKEVDKKTTIVGIGVVLFIIIGCVLLLVDASPKKGGDAAPEYLPLQIQGWESQEIETLCLDVKQSYPEEWFGFFKETLVNLGVNLTPRQFNFPYEEIITEILQHIGVTVVSDGTQCDAELTMSFTGTALNHRYGNIITKRGNSLCYAGSSVSGWLTLTASNKEAFESYCRSSVLPPGTLFSSECPDQPYEAPFDESSAGALTDGLVQLWGEDIAKTIRSLFYTGSSSEEAMYDAAQKVIKGEVTPYPTVPAAEPAIIETTEPSP